MLTIFETKLPDDVDHEQMLKDLNQLIDGTATIEIKPSARSGRGGKLGQVDPGVFDIIVHLLDTQAAAAVVQSVMSGITGYLLAKTGSKPRVEERPDRDKDD